MKFFIFSLLSIFLVASSAPANHYFALTAGGLGPELHKTTNAASDPNGNESDSTYGWAAYGGCALTSDPTSNVGAYALRGEGNQHIARFSFYLLNKIVVGKRYQLTFDARHIGTGGDWRVGVIWSASTFMPDPVVLTSSDTAYQSYRLTFTAKDTNTLGDTDYFLAVEDSEANDGGVYIDNFSLKEIF